MFHQPENSAVRADMKIYYRVFSIDHRRISIDK